MTNNPTSPERPVEVPKSRDVERDPQKSKFEFLKQRIKPFAKKVISQFRSLKRNNPEVELAPEEVELASLAEDLDNVLRETEAEETQAEKSAAEQVSEEEKVEKVSESLDAEGEIAKEEEIVAPTFISNLEKQALTKEIRDKRDWSYSSTRLTGEETRSLLEAIKNKIEGVGDEDKRCLYQELYNFIQRNGHIFPEFSHGTSGVVLRGILKNGLLPHTLIPKQDAIKGEKGRVNPARTGKNTRISAGIGVDGLGLAIGYAKRENDPLWMDDYYIEKALVERVVTPDLEGERTMQENPKYYLTRGWDDYLTQRCSAYREAYEKLVRKGDTWVMAKRENEFPLVIGFNSTAKMSDITERNFFGNKVLDNLMRGEVQFDDGDYVPAEAVIAIACPQKNIELVDFILRDGGRANVQVISIEALDLLSELGFTQVQERQDDALDLGVTRIKAMNLDRQVKNTRMGIPNL